MTNPNVTPTVAPTDSDRRVADAPEATTLRGSLNGDAAPTVRPVTRADDNAVDLRASSAQATDDGVRASGSSTDLDGEPNFWKEWHGVYVGYMVCKPASFESRVL